MSTFIHPTAVVDDGALIGDGTRVWLFCHIQARACIGERCSLGQNVNVAGGAVVGNGCKIQNNVSIYNGVELEDWVFCGPSCVFTNDLTPRARYPKDIAVSRATSGHPCVPAPPSGPTQPLCAGMMR